MAIKEGDRVRIGLLEEDYRVKWVGDRIVVLEAGDKTQQFLTTLDNLKAYFSSGIPELEK